MKPDIPYYSNTASGTHCAQASMRMGFEYFTPEKKWTFEELDELTGHVPGQDTWMMRSYIETNKLGYDVVVYDPIDFVELAKRPKEYIQEKFNPAYAEEVFRLTDLEAAVRDAEELLKQKDIQINSRSYSLEEYKALLDSGYLCGTWVDMAVTNHKENECEPHFILVYGYDEKGIYFHDPGGEKPETHQPNRHISWELFEQANKMNEQGERGEMMAFRKKN